MVLYDRTILNRPFNAPAYAVSLEKLSVPLHVTQPTVKRSGITDHV